MRRTSSFLTLLSLIRPHLKQQAIFQQLFLFWYFSIRYLSMLCGTKNAEVKRNGKCTGRLHPRAEAKRTAKKKRDRIPPCRIWCSEAKQRSKRLEPGIDEMFSICWRCTQNKQAPTAGKTSAQCRGHSTNKEITSAGRLQAGKQLQHDTADPGREGEEGRRSGNYPIRMFNFSVRIGRDLHNISKCRSSNILTF